MTDFPLNIVLTGITGYAENYLESIGYTSPGQTRLKAVTAINRAGDILSFDTAAIRIVTDNGVLLHRYATHSCQETETSTVTVEGEKGRMTWVQGQYAEWNEEEEIEKVEIESMGEAKECMWRSVLSSLVNGYEFSCTPETAMTHVELVERLRVENEIRNFPEELLHREKTNGDEKTCLPGLADDLKRCVSETALPSELEFAWAPAL